MVRRIIFSFLVTVLQTITYLLLVMFFGLIFTLFTRNDFESFFFLGIMYIMFFTIPCLFLNIIHAIVGAKWFNFISIGAPMAFYIIGWIEDIETWPLKTIFFLLIGIASYLSKMYFDELLDKRPNDTILLKNKSE